MILRRGRSGETGSRVAVATAKGRHRRIRTSGLSALDVRDGVADGTEVLRVVIGDRDAELVLAGVDDLDHRQRVDVEGLGERLVELHVLDRDTRDVVDDLSELLADLFGGGPVYSPWLGLL